jgi:exoribonuclease R
MNEIKIKFKIIIENREYSKWSFQNTDNNESINDTQYPILNTFNPLLKKCFNKDVFSIDNDIGDAEQIKSVYSSVRTNDKLAGVLILEKNKTYGRTSNHKRLLYKCIPDDTYLPNFLVPFDVKIGFSKFQKNKYVVFKFDHWNNKHPHGIITETIGDVDYLESFYEYQLYCKSLHISMTDFTNKTRAILNKKTQEQYIESILKNPNFHIEDYREKNHVFTIDPVGSVDFDDAFSIKTNDDLNQSTVSIYIANVFVWLETLGLWDSFSRRVATIYLPDRRRPMLPTILSDTLCSLQEKQPRFAFLMEFVIDHSNGHIGEPIFKNVIINVAKNYTYEENSLLYDNVSYKKLFEITCKLNRIIKNSHDLVSYWMIQMNTHIGKFMENEKIGIFRTTACIENENNNQNTDCCEIKLKELSEDTRRVVQNWNMNIGKYVLYDDKLTREHYMMNNTQYIHITSPIRRLVDLLNQIVILKHNGIVSTMSRNANDFFEYWSNQLEYINVSMRSIRKIQTDCFLLNRCWTDPMVIQKEYTGILFDKMMKNDGSVHYMVYLEELKLLSRIVLHQENNDMTNYSKIKCRIYLFENEEKTKKKIRLHLVSS